MLLPALLLASSVVNLFCFLWHLREIDLKYPFRLYLVCILHQHVCINVSTAILYFTLSRSLTTFPLLNIYLVMLVNQVLFAFHHALATTQSDQVSMSELSGSGRDTRPSSACLPYLNLGIFFGMCTFQKYLVGVEVYSTKFSGVDSVRKGSVRTWAT